MKITFMPEGKCCETYEKISVLAAAKMAGVNIYAPCGGSGKCGRCSIRINGKKMLACQTFLEKDTVVEIPQNSIRIKNSYLPDNFEFDIKGARKYRAAFDIGTTTVSAVFWENEKQVFSKSMLNPQSVCGADIISRIHFCIENGVELLQSKIIKCINNIIDDFAGKFNRNEIEEILIVGNTAMSHILLGISPKSLSYYPFKPQFEGIKNVYSSTLKINADCNVCVMPNIACHLGSDITADIIAADLKNISGKTILADIGTNSEIVFADDGKISVCSAAAGSVFEGSGIKFGMMASRGAVESIDISEYDIRLGVIGDCKPIGICGSGIIDIAAKLYEAGIIDKSGRIVDRNESKANKLISRRIINAPKGNNFIISYGDDDLIVAQNDIREFQLAKAAISAGINTLLKENNCGADDVDRILLAGMFGNHINIKSALKTGLLPDISPEKIIPIGNSAGTGANMALLSRKVRDYSLEVIKNITHIELSENEYFKREFINRMDF